LQRRALAAAGLLASLTAPPAAWAVLGESLASVQLDQQRMAGQRSLAIGAGPQVQLITLAGGSTIRQYLTSSGVVYAVAWNTRFKPRLDQLLGAHFPAYAEAARRSMQARPGIVHHAVLQQDDLVVETTAHLNAHVGRAYLRSLLPVGEPLDAIR
jgi:hypothetical protein